MSVVMTGERIDAASDSRFLCASRLGMTKFSAEKGTHHG